MTRRFVPSHGTARIRAGWSPEGEAPLSPPVERSPVRETPRAAAIRSGVREVGDLPPEESVQPLNLQFDLLDDIDAPGLPGQVLTSRGPDLGPVWMDAGSGVPGGGTVTRVDGGAGLTGSVTSSGSLAVGAGTGITVNADDVAIDRGAVDSWYAPAAHVGSSGDAHGPASGIVAGFMSSADFIKLAGIPANATANAGTVTQVNGGTGLTGSITSSGSLAINRAVTDTWYATAAQGARADSALQSLPIAGPSVLGGVKIGSGITVSGDGTISAAGGGGGASDLDGLSDVTLTAPAADQVLKFNGSQWVNAAAPGGGGGTVTQVDGGGGLTGSVTTTGSLAVGQGTGITVNPNDVAINRATVDAWYTPASHAGSTGSAHGLASDTVAGFMSNADFSKLTNIAPGATANSSDAQLRDRSTHTGTQPSSTISDFPASSRAQVEAALIAGSNITLTPAGTGGNRTITVSSTAAGGATNLDGLSDVTIAAPATDQVLKFNGTQWVNAAAPGGGGGTVTQVDGGAGLTGSVTTSGSLAVGQGAGITVNANDVAINRATVDTWYASAAQGALADSALQPGEAATPAQGALAATALQPGSVDLGFNASTRTITNTGGDSAVLPLVTSGAAGLAPQSGGGTSNFLRADGTWAAPPAAGATNLDGLSDVTIAAPATDQVLKFNGTQWVNAVAPGGGGGTVTQVTGGAGLTGSVTTTGSLAVGAGTGITVNADDVAINRATVDGWYLPRANHTGTQAVSTIQVANAARLIGAPAAAGPAQEIQVFGPLFFNAGALQIAPATGSFEGSMSSADFTKLAGIAPNATANPVAVDSNITGVTGADRITNMISLTQAEYDAIGTKNASTLYVISG